MNQSAYQVQYIIPPDSVPQFLASRSTNLRRLIRWSKEEHQRWTIRCIDRGYYKYLKVLNEEYSPIRFLAEMKGFRRICANITEHEWNKLSSRERQYICRTFQLREYLMGNKSDD